jgi:dihydroflavonol-4-reductase
MKVFLTGITGLLGNNIARALSIRGDDLLALVRGNPSSEVLEGIRVEIVQGDLDSKQAIEDAIASCDVVIHSAALIHLGWKRMEESMRVNRDGTMVVADAALKYGKRMVHVGTVNTMALATEGVPSDEETVITKINSQVPCAYVASKIASVEVVNERVAKGLDAVFVHPGFMLGPYDWKPSSGRMLLELGRGYKPIWPVGGCSVCDVRDVAAGVIAALDQGVTGRHYVLAGENMTYKNLWSAMATRMGKARPVLPVGTLLRAVASAAGDFSTSLTGNETDINSAGVKMSSQFHWHSSDRARAELGYINRDVNETLDDAAAWIKQRFL